MSLARKKTARPALGAVPGKKKKKKTKTDHVNQQMCLKNGCGYVSKYGIGPKKMWLSFGIPFKTLPPRYAFLRVRFLDGFKGKNCGDSPFLEQTHIDPKMAASPAFRSKLADMFCGLAGCNFELCQIESYLRTCAHVHKPAKFSIASHPKPNPHKSQPNIWSVES